MLLRVFYGPSWWYYWFNSRQSTSLKTLILYARTLATDATHHSRRPSVNCCGASNEHLLIAIKYKFYIIFIFSTDFRFLPARWNWQNDPDDKTGVVNINNVFPNKISLSCLQPSTWQHLSNDDWLENQRGIISSKVSVYNDMQKSEHSWLAYGKHRRRQRMSWSKYTDGRRTCLHVFCVLGYHDQCNNCPERLISQKPSGTLLLLHFSFVQKNVRPPYFLNSILFVIWLCWWHSISLLICIGPMLSK